MYLSFSCRLIIGSQLYFFYINDTRWKMSASLVKAKMDCSKVSDMWVLHNTSVFGKAEHI